MLIRRAEIDDATAIGDLIRPLARKQVAHEFSDEGARQLLASMTT